MRLKMTASEYIRFTMRVERLSNGCWLWTGYREKAGYGEFNFAGKRMRSHRISYRHFKGEIPNKTPILDHICENKPCVNPEHLEPVTTAENTRRWAIRKYQGKCVQGHPKEMGKHCGHCMSIKKARTWKRKFDGVCKRGHTFSADNIYWVGKNNLARLCRICNIAKQRRITATKKLALVHWAALLLHQPFLVPLPTMELFLAQSEQSAARRIKELESGPATTPLLPSSDQEQSDTYGWLW